VKTNSTLKHLSQRQKSDQKKIGLNLILLQYLKEIFKEGGGKKNEDKRNQGR